MSYDIIWMPRARISYTNILEYLEKNWSRTEVVSFRNHVGEVLEIIGKFPKIHEYSEENDTHRCVLTDQVSLYYQVKETQEIVELLVFWDNRQNPESLNLRD